MCYIQGFPVVNCDLLTEEINTSFPKQAREYFGPTKLLRLLY